jgi:hypothetical protein
MSRADLAGQTASFNYSHHPQTGSKMFWLPTALTFGDRIPTQRSLFGRKSTQMSRPRRRTDIGWLGGRYGHVGRHSAYAKRTCAVQAQLYQSGTLKPSAGSCSWRASSSIHRPARRHDSETSFGSSPRVCRNAALFAKVRSGDEDTPRVGRKAGRRGVAPSLSWLLRLTCYATELPAQAEVK